MKIAILGTRGIPARYGGFETFAEELSRRLAERGHEVTVYCRARHPEPRYRGVGLRYLPTIRHKYLDTIAHTFVSTLDVVFRRQDALLYCNGANAIFTLLPRLAGMPVALNVDGLERKRKKWNRAARAWYLVSEWLSTRFPNALVTDARTIAAYYRERYAAHSEFIPYGAETGPVATAEVLGQLGLEAGRYFLYVSRMEPENNALLVREAFESTGIDMKLALIGDAPYAADYIRQVRDTRDPRIVMPGAIYGQGYRELASHCYAYIHATEVGGTHPALIECMGRGAMTLYLDTPENAEVAGEAGIPFQASNLAEKLTWAAGLNPGTRQEFQRRALERIQAEYSWEKVTSDYEALLRRLAKR